jgi:hypothetical protein
MTIIIDGTGTISGVNATGLTAVQNLPATGTITNLTSTTATVTTLNAPSGVLATQNGMTGIAKAWVNYNGVANTLNASFNVSSVTKNGVGDYTINFTTAMPNTNYVTVAMVLNNTYGTTADGSFRGFQTKAVSVSTGSITILSKYVNPASSGQEDEDGVFVAVFSS